MDPIYYIIIIGTILIAGLVIGYIIKSGTDPRNDKEDNDNDSDSDRT